MQVTGSWAGDVPATLSLDPKVRSRLAAAAQLEAAAVEHSYGAVAAAHAHLAAAEAALGLSVQVTGPIPGIGLQLESSRILTM